MLPGNLVGLAAIGVLSLFLGYNPDRLRAPFGPSHDGFNAALYMTGGRAVIEDGLFASRFGALSRTLSGDRVVYAHHPPLVYLEDAVALTVSPTAEIAGRLPAVLSSLAVVVLVAFVVAACGLSDGAGALGLLFAFATPMFVLFGATTEPHALGLAPMAALMLLWQRVRNGLATSPWTMGVTAAAATLTSWQAGLFAASVAALLLVFDGRRKAAFAVAAGVAVASASIGLWMLWAYDGDLREFVERAVHRTGVSGRGQVTFLQMARQQVGYLGDLLPAGGALVVAIAALGLFDRRTRPLVAASLGTVLAYAALFRNGAYDHNYWLYCILLPLTLGAAAAADAVSRWLSQHPHVRAGPPLLVAALTGVLMIALWRQSGEERQREYAAVLGAQARALSWPNGQSYAYHAFGGRGPTDLLPWLRFYSRREPFGVDGPQGVPCGQVMLRLADGKLIGVAGERPVKP